MKKSSIAWLVTAAALIFGGLAVLGGVFAYIRGDISMLSTARLERREIKVTDGYDSVRLVSASTDVVLVASADGSTTLTCLDDERVKYYAEVTDGVLEIGYTDEREWYERIGVFVEDTEIRLALPSEALQVALTCGSGDVQVSGITLDSLELTSGTGDVELRELVSAGTLDIRLTTGDIEASDVSCGSFIAEGTTGDVELSDTVAENRLSVTLSTGDVDLHRCDAASVYVKNGTGDVEGTLLSEKRFTASSGTGDVSVPSSSGDGTCEVTTSTGDVRLRIVD